PSESVAASASATPSSSATAEPTAAAVAPIITWEEPAVFNGNPTEILADGDTWVAVGGVDPRGPGAWTSSDGQTWEPAEVVDPQPDPMFPGSKLGPTVRFGDSLLSYGTFIGCCDGRGVLGWRSADGRSWEVIESRSPLFATGYLVNELVVGDQVIVAVEGRYSTFSGRLWRWTEEASWVETTPNTAGTDQPSGMTTSDVTWADGRFVAVGARGDPPGGGPVRGASWTSTDGQAWEESAAAPELEDVELLEVAPVPGGGYVALGISDAANFGNDSATVALTSPDGLAWTPAQMPSMGPLTRPIDVITVDEGLVAIGSTTESEGSSTTVWTSADGATWTDDSHTDGWPVAIAAMGDQLVLITTDSTLAEHTFHRGTLSR
ncbi:MAG: hypothetical protein ACRDFY_09560, partial [Candidatus Limnocylindria bacterium]